MRRYEHYWWPARGKYCPSRIAVLDCDLEPSLLDAGGNPGSDRVTRWFLHSAEMRRGACVSESRRHGQTGTGALLALASLCSSRETTWVFLPNAIRQLIALGFFQLLEDRRWQLAGNDWKEDRGDGKSGEDKPDGLCCLEDPPTLILCRPHDKIGKILLLDVRNYGIDTPAHGQPPALRAGEILRGILSIVQVLRQDRPVSLRGTAAAQAVQILRTRHDVMRLRCHTHAAATRIERAAYFGGRCEALRTGVILGPVYHLDVRSMYPAIARDLPIPVALRSYHADPASAKRVATSGPGDCAADVSIRCPVPAFPCRREGDIVYPVGDYRTCLCGPDLEYAIKRHCITRWHACARYTCAPVLRGFYEWGLDTMLSSRNCGLPIVRQWLKRVMTGLVGKFGEPGRRWVGIPARAEREPYGEWQELRADGKLIRYRNVAGYTQRLEEYGESYNSMPAVAAWITSAGRVRLWYYHQTTGRENVWYSDTDSLLTGQVGFDRLLRAGLVGDGAPGDLRLVGCHSSAIVHGIRHYQLGDSIACAGVPRGAIRPGETREDYWRRVGAATKTVMERIRRGVDDGRRRQAED